MFRVDLLPVNKGDCIWIEYGDPEKPRRILIDCGQAEFLDIVRSRIKNILPLQRRRFELLIATHIDVDHIGGLAQLLEDRPAALIIGDIWFNGYRHLPVPERILGVRKAEEATEALARGGLPWNEAFNGGPVEIPDKGRLPQRLLPGGMKLTLLSPYRKQLEELYPLWHRELKLLRRTGEVSPPPPEKGLFLGPVRNIDQLAAAKSLEDQAKSNGSSIAVLAEYEDCVLLLAGDALSDVLVRSLDRLALQRKVVPLCVDAFKVSHHGSAHSTSSRLLRRVLCKHYLFSTNGSVHGHPARETIARILTKDTKQKTLHFNYRSDSTLIWNDPWLKRRYSYETSYPTVNSDGVSLSLI